MAILDHHNLRQQAADRLENAPNRSKLVLLFVCMTAGLSLAAGIISVILDGQIAETGGLGGLQARSILSTVQALLNIALFAFVPFWNLGYTSVALKWSRGEASCEKDLLNGFRRFGPALRLMLLRQVVYFIVAFAVVQVSSILFTFTPWAMPFYQQLDSSGMMDPGAIVDIAAMEPLITAMIPYWIIAGGLYLAALIPVTYRLRMAEFRIMDEHNCGALMALLQSNRMMKGNCVKLFKVDLQFWWYYLASILIPVLCYGDVLLPAIGVELPFDPMVSFFLFYVVAQLAQILLYWLCRNQVECTYACAYDELLENWVLPAPPPQNTPWNY